MAEELENTPQFEGEPQTELTDTNETEINSTLDISDEDFDKWFASIDQQKDYDDYQSDNVVDETLPQEEQPQAQQESANEEIVDEELFEIKANGITHQVTLEELKQLAPKAFDYTKKMQEIAPMRKTLNAMKENNITAEDINQLIDIKKGNPLAKQNFLLKYKLNEVEQETDEYGNPIESKEKYTPNEYGSEPSVLADIISELQDNPNYPILQRVVSKLDEKSKAGIVEYPNLLNIMMQEIDNGTYKIVANEVAKMEILNPYDDRPYLHKYAEASQKLSKRYELQKQKQQKGSQSSSPLETQMQALSAKRKAASLTGNRNIVQPITDSGRVINSTTDITDKELDQYLISLGLPT